MPLPFLNILSKLRKDKNLPSADTDKRNVTRFTVLSVLFEDTYRAGVQDAPQERNKAAAKQSKVRPTTQLLLTFPPFPAGHPAHEHGI